jgi:hypothetical protein
MLNSVFRGGNKIVGYAILFLVFVSGIVLSFFEPAVPYESFTSVRWLDITIVGVLSLSSGLFLNGFLIRNKFIHINNIAPGFLLILFLTGLPNQASQVSIVTSVFLIVLLIRKFTSIHNTINNYFTVFEIGVILGIIALITPQFSGIIFLSIIGLTLVKTYSWRDFLIPLLGVLFVVFLKGVYNFMIDKQIDWITLIDIHFYKPKLNSEMSVSQVILSGITAIEFLFIYNLFNVIESKNIRERVHYWLWIWLSVFLLFSMLFMQSPVNKMELILLIGLPVSVFSKEFLDASMKSWQRDLTMVILIISVLSLRVIPLF